MNRVSFVGSTLCTEDSESHVTEIVVVDQTTHCESQEEERS